MNDVEMLVECISAFRSSDTADHANKFLKRRGQSYAAYTGTGQEKLRKYMIEKLAKHILTQHQNQTYYIDGE